MKGGGVTGEGGKRGRGRWGVKGDKGMGPGHGKGKNVGDLFVWQRSLGTRRMKREERRGREKGR